MTIDTTLQILQAIGNILSLVILVLLWRKAFRPSPTRRFFVWLALAWTVNLFGNVAWIVHDLVTGTELDTLSIVDLFYVLHYVLVGFALWLYPASLPRRAWIWIGGVMLVAGMLVWAIYFNPAMALRGGDWTNFLGVALYPVLDAGIIALAWLRFIFTRGTAWHRYSLLLFYAMISYGIANTINMTEYILLPISGGILPNLLWTLTSVLLLVLVLSPDLPEKTPGEE